MCRVLPVLLIALASVGAVCGAAPVQLLVNGDVEAVDAAGRPVGWSPGASRDGVAQWSCDERVAHGGSRSLKIVKTAAAGQCHWVSGYLLLRLLQAVPVEFSVWIKAEESPHITVVVEVETDADRYFQYLTPVQVAGPGIFDWRQFTASLTLRAGGQRLRVFLRQNATGTVWFDEVSLTANTDVRAGQAPSAPTAAAIVPAAPPVPADGERALDFRDWIDNPRMAGTWTADELPPGWSVHHPADTETQAQVTWLRDAPRPGYFTLRLDWLAGGKYIAVEPALRRPLAGAVPLVLLTYARTEGDGKAQTIVQCFDAAGTLVQEERSAIVANARDLATLEHRFVTHPQTARARVFAANVGAGKVWFHWCSLVPDPETASRAAAFPFTVSCEPAEGNRFWNDGHAVLNSFADSPTSVSFAFWGDKSRLDRPRLIVELPPGLTIPEAFNLELRAPVNHAKAAFATEPVQRDGQPYVRYTFAEPAALQRLTVRPYLYNCLTLCFVPERFEPQRSYEIFYHVENGGQAAAERQVTLRVLPPMPVTPNPKRFVGHLWTLDDLNFYDLALVEKAVRKYEEAGLAGRERWTVGRDEVRRVDGFLKQRGWFLFMATGDYGFRASPQHATGADGQVSPSMYCPSAAIADEGLLAQSVVPTLKRELADAGVTDGEFVFLDYEPGSISTKFCFDERCRRRFAQRSGIPLEKIPDRRAILANYGPQWGEFWCYLCDQIVRRHAEAVKRVNPSLRNAMYGYALPFADPAATREYLFGSPLDTRLLQEHLDRLLLSFYHIVGKPALDLIDINAHALQKPVFMMPLMGSTTPYWGSVTDDQILSPPAMRVHVLAGAAGGAAGVIPYQGKMMDGMYLLAIDRAMAEIAAVEDFYFEGRRCEAELAVTRVGGALGDDWGQFVGWRAHRLGARVLVALLNFHPQRGVALALQGPAGLQTRDGVTGPALTAGAPLELPALDGRLIVLEPKP